MIVIKDLVKRYGGHTALDHVNLSVDRGAVLGLLGPNGAGKTTLVAVLNGLTGFQRGEITVFGLALGENLREIRRRSAFIPQSLALYDSLSVRENLRFFAGIQDIDRRVRSKNIEYAIGVNRLESMLDQKAGQLSGGQRQRLNIGIGLLNNPELLYFDEPTAGIDPELRNEILESIRILAAEGKTVVYTSHYLPEIEKICDRAAIIHKGKILRQGTLEELLQQNRSSVFIELVAPVSKQRLSAVQALCGVSRVDETTLMAEDSSASAMTGLLTALEQENLQIRHIRYGATTLETYFLRLTSEGNTDV